MRKHWSANPPLLKPMLGENPRKRTAPPSVVTDAGRDHHVKHKKENVTGKKTANTSKPWGDHKVFTR